MFGWIGEEETLALKCTIDLVWQDYNPMDLEQHTRTATRGR